MLCAVHQTPARCPQCLALTKLYSSLEIVHSQTYFVHLQVIRDVKRLRGKCDAETKQRPQHSSGMWEVAQGEPVDEIGESLLNRGVLIILGQVRNRVFT